VGVHWSEEIQKLDGLRQSGAVSEEEFRVAKERILARVGAPNAGGEWGGKFMEGWNALGAWLEREEVWGALIHLSQFCGYAIPLAGFAAPLGLWMARRKESETIDRHGRVVLNWMISHLIYWAIGGVLCLVVVGFWLLLGLAVVSLVFPLVGAYRAFHGEVWGYPLSFPFFAKAGVREPVENTVKER
jgi:uncharacterized Tic20 family protein